MPYPNEHAARQNDPGKYKRVRRQNDKFDDGIHVIWGITEDGDTEVQAIRFDASKWSAAKAKKWLKDNGYKSALEEATDTSLCLALGAAQRIGRRGKDENGIPVQKYRKELIRKGRYVKDDLHFEVTDHTLSHWVNQFNRMQENGVEVYVVSPHDDTGDPAKSRGRVLELYQDGESLWMDCVLIGEDAILAASRSDVSIYSPASFKDGKGNVYLQPIRNVALVTTPVVPGLDAFVPIAASLANAKENEMDLKKLGKALKLQLEEETAAEAIVAAFEKQGEALTKVTEDLKAAEKKVVELGKKQPDGKVEEPDPVLVQLSHENRQTKLDALVSAGKITPAVRDDLQGLFIGEKDAALVLSLKTGTTDIFNGVIAALAKNDPVKLAEQTGPQTTIELSDSRKTNSPAESALVKNAEARAQRMKASA